MSERVTESQVKITELEEILAGLRLERDPEADGPVPEMFK